jgi:hypothetical protein
MYQIFEYRRKAMMIFLFSVFFHLIRLFQCLSIEYNTRVLTTIVQQHREQYCSIAEPILHTKMLSKMLSRGHLKMSDNENILTREVNSVLI